MQSRIPRVLAALLAAGAFPLAHAQDTYVQEPVASATLGGAAPAEQLNALAQALNNDASLKGSKITVQAEPESGTVLLTGVTQTYAQSLQASKIAQQHVGDGKFVNTLASSEVVLLAPPPRDHASMPNMEAAQEPADTTAQPQQQQQPTT